MGFLFDQNHYDIAMAEQELSDGEKDFSRSCDDKRSTNYKKVAPLVEETRKYIASVKKESVGLGTIMAMREVEVTALKYYREINQKRYFEVYDMVTLKKSDYLKFVARISVQLHDKFCDCDKLEFKETPQ